jgi:ligand-binding SRPBCC domain-containing protein
VPSFSLQTSLLAPPAECFALSLSVDAHTASMGPSSERVVAGTRSGEMGLGDTVTWQARHFGLPFRMTSTISEYDAPRRFVDQQVRGPFGSWRHEHLFAPAVEGGTTMTDVVEFRSPLGPLGAMVDRLVLAAYIRRLIEQRNDWLSRELAAGS